MNPFNHVIIGCERKGWTFWSFLTLEVTNMIILNMALALAEISSLPRFKRRTYLRSKVSGLRPPKVPPCVVQLGDKLKLNHTWSYRLQAITSPVAA